VRPCAGRAALGAAPPSDRRAVMACLPSPCRSLGCLFLCFCLCLRSPASARVVSISNAEPRRDTRGEIMDCHDGNILRLSDGLYWLFCMAYGPCHNHGCASDQCGGRLDHNISIYSSPNLTSGSWSYRADLLPLSSRPAGTYYRPKVVFNPNTHRYVFWVNILPRASATAPVDFTKSSYLVATSSQPQGP
jgi:hypothetical protein